MQLSCHSLCLKLFKPAITRIDNQVVELQIYSEKHCRHIYRPDSPFTLDYSIWHKRARVFSSMQRMVEGRVRQPSLLCKQACKLGIM
jgi:hypothetical protein